MIAGYLYRSRRIRNARAGVVTGLVGGIPIVVWELWATLIGARKHFAVIHSIDDPRILAVMSVGAALLAAVVLLIVLFVLGYAGGIVGGWLNERIGSARLLSSKT